MSIVKSKILIKPYARTGSCQKGLDLAVRAPDATVGDYCQVLDEYILRGSFSRLRSQADRCEGCDTCCRERAPLTSIDVDTLSLHLGLSRQEFLKRFAYVYVRGGGVDICLARDPREKCLFLHPRTGKCTCYEKRPFVCRTYICTTLSPRAKALREAVTNSGEDELVRLWLKDGEEGGLIIHEADNPAVAADQWPENCWTGKKDFSEVFIKELVSPKLWSELYEGEDHV